MDKKARFERVFDHISTGRNRYETWSDFIAVTACAIANAVKMVKSREEMYVNVMQKYEPREQRRLLEAAETYFELVEENPFQDLLGDLYMRLGLGNAKAGQFFTPYHVCVMMARMQVEHALESIEHKGWIGINDCACGGGATLIAMADALYQRGCNYQQRAFFVGQDLIGTTAMMCYIQLSMLGCAGYVKCGDAIGDPVTGNSLLAPEGDNIWITPMYYSDVWTGRRLAREMDHILRGKEGSRATVRANQELPEAAPSGKPKKPVPVMVIQNQQISFFGGDANE